MLDSDVNVVVALQRVSLDFSPEPLQEVDDGIPQSTCLVPVVVTVFHVDDKFVGLGPLLPTDGERVHCLNGNFFTRLNLRHVIIINGFVRDEQNSLLLHAKSINLCDVAREVDDLVAKELLEPRKLPKLEQVELWEVIM